MTLTERSSIPKDLRRSLVSASTSRGDSSEEARAETSGTYLRAYQQMNFTTGEIIHTGPFAPSLPPAT